MTEATSQRPRPDEYSEVTSFFGRAVYVIVLDTKNHGPGPGGLLEPEPRNYAEPISSRGPSASSIPGESVDLAASAESDATASNA